MRAVMMVMLCIAAGFLPLVCSRPQDGVIMSMQRRPLPEVPVLTAQVARAAFPGGSLAMRIRDELGAWCEDEAFSAVYGTRGAPGLSPAQLAVVTGLQFAENLTDRQAADAVRGRIDWKYCLGLEVTDPGFDFSVLSEVRGRLVAGGRGEAPPAVLAARPGGGGPGGPGERGGEVAGGGGPQAGPPAGQTKVCPPLCRGPRVRQKARKGGGGVKAPQQGARQRPGGGCPEAGRARQAEPGHGHRDHPRLR